MEYNVTSVTKKRFKVHRDKRQKILREYRKRIRSEVRFNSALAIEEQIRERYAIPARVWAMWMVNIADGVWTWDGEPVVQKKVA